MRVALITRRFWPLVGGAETMVSNLAVEFLRLGAKPTIVTAQWQTDWPAQMWCREAPVVRLPSPKALGWGTFRYVRALSTWLRRHRQEFDAVCVSRLRHDAYAAVTALGGGSLPVVLRNEGSGETGDCAWHQQARFGRRILKAIQAASAVIAPTVDIARESRRAGFRDNQVVSIPNGVEIAPARSPQRRAEARQALAEANRDLAAHPQAPVAVFIGRLHPSRRLLDLLRAFRVLVQSNPNATLWLIGDGPQRADLYREIVDAGLHHNILMPGIFDDVEQILQAADLFLSPSDQDAVSQATLQAMAYGLPVVAADVAGNRELIQHDRNGWLAPTGNVSAWSEAIAYLWRNPGASARLGAAAQQTIRDRYSITHSAKQHLQLMESLLDRKNSTVNETPSASSWSAT